MSVAETTPITDHIPSVRAKANLFLESNAFPSNRDEEWRFTALRKYVGGELSFTPIENNTAVNLPPFYHQCKGTKIVLHNGVLDEKNSVIEADGFTLNSNQKALLKLDTAIISPNYFTAFNTAHFQYGLTIEITGNPTSPISIFHIIDNENTVLPRLLIQANKNTNTTINELFFDNTTAAKVVTVSEVFVEKNAAVYFNSVVVNNPKLALINTLEAHCERDGRFYHASYISESRFVRNNIHARLDDENSYSSLSGFYGTQGENLADNHVLIDHRKPNCESHQLFKGLLTDESTGVFNGKIMVHIDAQKTNAFQSSKAVLLTDTATIQSKPQLEIFADDVKCSHGAAIGQMNKNEIFYFKARGIDEATAKAILNLAYTAEVLEKVTDETLRLFLMERLKAASGIEY